MVPRAILSVSQGDMELAFFPEAAPKHVESFLNLSRKGFYDGTLFHRVVPGFVIQGGDPLTKESNRARWGTGGPGYSLRAEFSERPHKRGILSMARSSDPHSAGSQFFVCLQDVPQLDRQYTVFGEVVRGMEAADRIAALPRDARDCPVQPVPMKVRVVE